MDNNVHEWAKYLTDSELDIIRRTLLRHVSDATWCSDEEAQALLETAQSLGEEMTKRETRNLTEIYPDYFRDD